MRLRFGVIEYITKRRDLWNSEISTLLSICSSSRPKLNANTISIFPLFVCYPG